MSEHTCNPNANQSDKSEFHQVIRLALRAEPDFTFSYHKLSETCSDQLNLPRKSHIHAIICDMSKHAPLPSNAEFLKILRDSLRSDPEIILVGSHTAIEQLLNDQTLLTQAIQAAPLSMTGHRFITCEDGKAPQYIDYSQLRTEVQEASDYSDLFRPLIYAEPEYTIGWIHPAQNVCELANMPSKTAVLTLTVDMSKYATLQEHRELFEQIYSGIRFNPNFVLIGSSTAVAQLMQDDALFAQTLQAAPFHGDGHRYITCEDGKAPQYIDYSLPRDQNKKHH